MQQGQGRLCEDMPEESAEYGECLPRLGDRPAVKPRSGHGLGRPSDFGAGDRVGGGIRCRGKLRPTLISGGHFLAQN